MYDVRMTITYVVLVNQLLHNGSPVVKIVVYPKVACTSNISDQPLICTVWYTLGYGACIKGYSRDQGSSLENIHVGVA